MATTIEKIIIRRGPKSNLPTLDVGEPAITLDTKELSVGTPNGNALVGEKNDYYSPINYADKESGLPFWVKQNGSGNGTLAYDPNEFSTIGRGAYVLNGSGTWMLDRMYAVSPLAGVGAHISIRRISGSSPVSIGAIFYADDGATVVGNSSQQNFILNTQSVNNSSFETLSAFLVEGGIQELPINARFMKLKIQNGLGSIAIDNFVSFPLRTFDPSQDGKVGDVTTSMLAEPTFQSLRGDQWVLADGRSITGSVYEALTGESSIPDLRGMFLRGKNNGRVDGLQDPDGERNLGSYQADEYRSHRHTIRSSAFDSDTTVNGSANTTGGFSKGTITSSDPTNYSGGNETRSKNIAVNYFIKIN